MRLSVLTRASQILADKVKTSSFNLSECKVYSEEAWQKHGYIVICVVKDGNVVGVISQDMYSAECLENIKEAERFMISKLHKILGEQ